MPGYARSNRTSRGAVRRTARAPARRRTGVKKAVRAAKQRTFTKAVKSVMFSQLETKKKSVILGGATEAGPLNIKASGLMDAGYGVHIGNLWNVNGLTIDQGTGQNQHIGRTIDNCRLFLKVCVQATFHNEATNTDQFPFEVWQIVYKDKLAPNTNVPEELKINPSGTAAAISGTAINFMLPFNLARYTVYSNKCIARFKPMPIDRAEVLDANLQNPTIGSNSNVAYKYLTTKLPCPKTLDFKASGSALVTNAHLGIGWYVINGSGVSLGVSQIRATVYPTATLYYKDS